MAYPSIWDDEPFGGDQALEDAEYEANARYDYLREAYGATAEGLEDYDDEGKDVPYPVFATYADDEEVPF